MAYLFKSSCILWNYPLVSSGILLYSLELSSCILLNYPLVSSCLLLNYPLVSSWTILLSPLVSSWTILLSPLVSSWTILLYPLVSSWTILLKSHHILLKYPLNTYNAYFLKFTLNSSYNIFLITTYEYLPDLNFSSILKKFNIEVVQHSSSTLKKSWSSF